MKITSKEHYTEKDFDSIVQDLMNKYGTIFFASYDNEHFIYKPLSRKEYKQIVENEYTNDLEKEDAICMASVLWPEDIDWDEIEAGIPAQLCAEIIDNSFLNNSESIAKLIEVYRDEMNLIDYQMCCIVSEAFPNYDIEDIENWDMIKFCRIFTKAEWKLKHLRKIDDIADVTEFLHETGHVDSEKEIHIENTNIDMNKDTNMKNNIKNASATHVKVGNREMTDEEFQQYRQLQQQFPEIDWTQDTMYTGFETQNYNSAPVALR